MLTGYHLATIYCLLCTEIRILNWVSSYRKYILLMRWKQRVKFQFKFFFKNRFLPVDDIREDATVTSILLQLKK